MAENSHGPLGVQQGVDPPQPLLRAAQGQVNHGMGHLGEHQFLVLAHVHQLQVLPR